MFPKKLQRSIHEINKALGMLETECDRMNRVCDTKSKIKTKVASSKSPPVRDEPPKPILTGPTLLRGCTAATKTKKKNVGGFDKRPVTISGHECGLCNHKCAEGAGVQGDGAGKNADVDIQQSYRIYDKTEQKECVHLTNHKSIESVYPDMSSEACDEKTYPIGSKPAKIKVNCGEKDLKFDEYGCENCRKPFPEVKMMTQSPKQLRDISPSVTSPRHEGCFKENHRAKKGEFRLENDRPRVLMKSPIKKKVKKKVERPAKEVVSRLVDCQLWTEDPKTQVSMANNPASNSPLQAFNILITELKGRGLDPHSLKLVERLEHVLRRVFAHNTNNTSTIRSHHSGIHPMKAADGGGASERDVSDAFLKLQHNYQKAVATCEALRQEKLTLADDVDRQIKVMESMLEKEQEYERLISRQKLKLDKTHIVREENAQLARELLLANEKLSEQTKKLDALQSNHVKMQERLQMCLLENDKVKSQCRMSKLEAQKYMVLLEGRDVEIKRYKQDIEVFRSQIVGQLSVLRTCKASSVHVERAMNAIMKHSKIFSQSDLESVASDSVLSSKQPRVRRPGQDLHSLHGERNRPLHSSPTSARDCRDAPGNSSWTGISSIHEDHAKDLVVISKVTASHQPSVGRFGVPDTRSCGGDSPRQSPSRAAKSRPNSPRHSPRSPRSPVSPRSPRSARSAESVGSAGSPQAVERSFTSCLTAHGVASLLSLSGLTDTDLEVDETDIRHDTERLKASINTAYEDMRQRCQERVDLFRMGVGVDNPPDMSGRFSPSFNLSHSAAAGKLL